ncbi:ABC transporter ATP-binding protein [Rhodococcus chondri]|uniref:ABC transporter ATP-binding protein n=1 Tax=Rhodococcus chondri TaxID=3065941 RepID=A0ABU7JYL2_9NOCA|nr:ABC transporter ATP-binding protein [Rhodococcus sp. CC-R104]MEE2035100.1 ABC transporter ATP-binding protein [Rhodococcus sp. CC-R104]
MSPTYAPDRTALLRIDDLVVEYPTAGGTIHAVSGVSFDVRRGETLGIVGESGSGKSTLLRAVLRLTPVTGGAVHYGDHELTSLTGEEMRQLRPDLQMIIQDPIASLNPRRTVRELVAEGLRIWPQRVTDTVDEQVRRGLDAVSLDVDLVGDRRPKSFSGGQCQRIAIARALALQPRVLFCDEPVSALDVSVQARILNLIRELRRTLDLTVVFVSHDLGVVKNVSDRVMVLYLGRVCELAPAEQFFAAPAHPYSRLLLSAAPGSGQAPEHEQTGEPPSPLDPPSGCRFRSRCPQAQEICATDVPEPRDIGNNHFVACHFPLLPTVRD